MMTKHGAVPVVGRSHVTATKFAFFAEERPTKKLQDPGLSVPGIDQTLRALINAEFSVLPVVLPLDPHYQVPISCGYVR